MFDPWTGKIPYAMKQPSPLATTIEPSMLLSLGTATTEAHGPRAHTLQQEKSPQCKAWS